MRNNKLQVSRPKTVRKKISESLKKRYQAQGGSVSEYVRRKISEKMTQRWKERKQELENKQISNDELNGK